MRRVAHVLPTGVSGPASLLLGLGLRDHALRIVVEELFASGAADVIGLALVLDGDRAAAPRDDADRRRVPRGEV